MSGTRRVARIESAERGDAPAATDQEMYRPMHPKVDLLSGFIQERRPVRIDHELHAHTFSEQINIATPLGDVEFAFVQTADPQRITMPGMQSCLGVAAGRRKRRGAGFRERCPLRHHRNLGSLPHTRGRSARHQWQKGSASLKTIPRAGDDKDAR